MSDYNSDFRIEQNNYSDRKFAEDMLNRIPDLETGDPVFIVADGAFTCDAELVEKKNAVLEDHIKRYPGGFVHKSCSYNIRNGQCIALFERDNCEICPYRDR